MEAHGLIRFLKSEVTKSDEGLEMGRQGKRKTLRLTPWFLRAGWGRYDGHIVESGFWT